MPASREIVRQAAATARSGREDVCIRVEGTVQGVGFRPFVYRLARECGVRGWVRNDARGVLIGATASPGTLSRFENALRNGTPPAARIDRIYRVGTTETHGEPIEGESFTILESRESELVGTLVSPDLAVCPDCLREMNDPADRRYRYPFINCTNCGPRYSITESIPYDRPGTTMRGFPMCPACAAEYGDPADRRFHAQPVACPVCGPRLSYWDARGRPLAAGEEALLRALGRLREGAIIAVKGIGGFHLMCDAASDEAVGTLRYRKQREEKPFALMAPYPGAARRLCRITREEAILLASPRAPIVLVPRRSVCCGDVSSRVAPENPLLGIMLPYAPLHHLLMEAWQGFLVATSGNRSDEPICIDEGEALKRLSGIADGFLVHDRPIARPVDDSIVRFMRGSPVVLRRARGYAPGPVPGRTGRAPLLAVGAHMKNAVAVAANGRVFPGQHIGDLSTTAANEAFENSIGMLTQLYRSRPGTVVCDLHPDYPSSVWASRQGLPVIRVQHHHAHVMACLAEHPSEEPVLGVAWDGTGYGTDRTVWGGEWLEVEPGRPGFRRLACLRPFRLPGGEAAIRHPSRTAFGLLWELFGESTVHRREVAAMREGTTGERAVLARMLARGVNAPVTSSAGRLFDGVAALLGLGEIVSFEGQAAMKLEFLAAESDETGVYGFSLVPGEPGGDVQAVPTHVVDWRPMLREILAELGDGTGRAAIARRFHNTLAAMILAVARLRPERPVVLTGGCFQNKILFETTADLLEANGFAVMGHREVPPNDGGLAVGQIAAAMNALGECCPTDGGEPEASGFGRSEADEMTLKTNWEE